MRIGDFQIEADLRDGRDALERADTAAAERRELAEAFPDFLTVEPVEAA